MYVLLYSMEAKQIYIVGVIGQDTTDLDVIRQVKALGDVDEITVNINSIGGIIEQGFSIYNYLKNHPANITTVGRGNVNSIATVIFQAGNKRLLDENLQSFVIHNANIDPMALGQSVDANMLDVVSKHLRAEEERITQFYSDITKIDNLTLSNLMDKETNLTAQEAIELGFADSTFNDIKAAAKYYINNLEMDKKANTIIESIKNLLSGFNARNSVEVQTENGDRFYIDMTGEDMTDKRITVMTDGEMTDTPAPNGEHVLTSGKVITVNEGVIAGVRDRSEERFEEKQDEAIEDKTNMEEMEDDKMSKLIADEVAKALEPLKAQLGVLENSVKASTEALEEKAQEAVNAKLQGIHESLKNLTTNFKIPTSQSNTNSQPEHESGSLDAVRAFRAAKNKK